VLDDACGFTEASRAAQLAGDNHATTRGWGRKIWARGQKRGTARKHPPPRAGRQSAPQAVQRVQGRR
jgi:hypothetical protein